MVKAWASHEEIKRYRSNPVNSQSLSKPDLESKSDGLMFHFQSSKCPKLLLVFCNSVFIDKKKKEKQDSK